MLPGGSISDSSVTAPKRQWGKVSISGFGEGGVQYNEALVLQKAFCESSGSDVTNKRFIASLDMRRCKD